MIGAGGIVGALILLLISIVLAIIGAGLLIAALIAFIRQKTTLPITLLIVGSIFVAPFLLVQIKNAEIRRKEFDVHTSIPLDTVGYKLHPDVFIMRSDLTFSSRYGRGKVGYQFAERRNDKRDF